MINWSECEKCKNCGAEEGEACRTLVGNLEGFIRTAVAKKPHKGRKKKKK